MLLFPRILKEFKYDKYDVIHDKISQNYVYDLTLEGKPIKTCNLIRRESCLALFSRTQGRPSFLFSDSVGLYRTLIATIISRNTQDFLAKTVHILPLVHRSRLK